MIQLGDRVVDKITGLKGIAIGETQWLYGCNRITIQPEEFKDGKPVDSFCVDREQLELVKAQVIIPKDKKEAEKKNPAGPRESSERQMDPKR